MATPIITLTTDFGTRDGYVAAIKGYLMSRIACQLVDVTHDIARGDVAHAAWVVRSALRQFPPDSIHYVVVDPGVGSARRGVVVEEDDRIFVGPDNGAFAYLQPDAIHVVNLPTRAFNGREQFAPIVTIIAERPVAIASLGPRTDRLALLPWGERLRGEGRVVHVDGFGNAITDLPGEECAAPGVQVEGRFAPLLGTYADGAPGQLIAYLGNEGTIELAVRDGRAGLERGALVVPAEPGGVYR